MIEQELPEGWVETKLGEIFTFIGGGTPNKSNPSFWNGNLPWASVKDIKDKYLIGTQDKITHEAVHASATNIALVGEVILITRINPGRVCISKIESAVNQDLKIIKSSSEISSYFTYYLFNCLEPQILKGSSGTTVLGITLSNLYDVKFSLPPLAEQHRIVAKIEELFSELDNGIETLNKAKQQLKIYRQAVLKYAFEGKLTNPDVKEGELPVGWELMKFGDVFEIFIGSTPSRKVSDYWNGTINWVSSGEVAFCKINRTREKISEIGLENSSCKMHPPGTIILAMIGEGKTRGQAAILNCNASHNQNTAAIRVNHETFISELLYYYLVLTYEKNRGEGSGNNQKALNKELVKNFVIPVIPIEQQKILIQEIESRLSICDKIEESIEQGLKQAEALRQSILKRAFEGKLVPQDPSDEPANVLLERVKAERAAKNPVKKISTKKSKA